MEKDFTPYEQALALKELGFNRRTLAQYNTRQGDEWILTFDLSGEGQYPNSSSACVAPTFSQAFRWFRDNHGLVSWISFRIDLKKKYLWYITDVKNIATRDGDYIFDILIESYEEAELACLKKLIEIVNGKQ